MSTLIGYKGTREYVSPTEPKLCGGFLITRIGEMTLQSECKIDEPEQSGQKVIGVISGKGIVTVRSTDYAIRGNQVCLVRPNEAFSIACDGEEPVRCFYISFGFSGKMPVEGLSDAFRELFVEGPFRQTAGSVEIQNLYGRIVRELLSADEFSGRMLALNVEQMLLLICRSFALSSEKFNTSDDDGEGNIVERIIGLLEANCGTLKNLSELSNMLGYSYPYLSHVFTRRMGKSIKEYYQQLLFERAVEMLKSDMSITQISDQLGYQAIHSFSRAFSNHYGVSPSRYIDSVKRTANKDKKAKSGGAK